MANFDEFKKAAAETAGVVADKSIVLARMIADKTKLVARIAVLRAEISSEKELLRKNFKELGKAYYDAHKDAPEPALEQLCTDVGVSAERIAAKRSEIEQLKEQLKESDTAADAAEDAADAAVDVADADEPAPTAQEVVQAECACTAEAPADAPCCCGCEAAAEPEAPADAE